jgi:hypothetical protein
MRAWKQTALSVAVLLATALLLRLLAGPAVPQGPVSPEHAASIAPPQPEAVAFVAEHPAVAHRLTPMLDRDVRVMDAARGFTDPILFAAVVHASDNLNVPFILLKERVLTRGSSLLDAIRAVRPNVDAGTEALRAYNQARRSVGR